MEWTHLFASYRVLVARHDEVVQGVLHPSLDVHAPEVEAFLQQWPGQYLVAQRTEGTTLTLVRRRSAPTRERWWLHLLLLLLTLGTTTVAGALFLGYRPFVWHLLPLGDWQLPVPVRFYRSQLLPGLWFSLPLLGVLLAHELGHYLIARRYRLDVSPPYFLPVPHFLNVIGTFGAFIRLRSLVLHRAMMLTIGAGGPLASFLLSLPLLALGLAYSAPLPALQPTTRLAVIFAGQPIWLGESLVVHALADWFAPAHPALLLHPFAFAGWLGLFVTTLNLFPLAQLDGGHILYGLIGPRQRPVAFAFLALLLLLGNPRWGGWWGWWLWAALVLLIGRGRVTHPTVLDATVPVTGWRRTLGWACMLIFLLTFVPLPLRL